MNTYVKSLIKTVLESTAYTSPDIPWNLNNKTYYHLKQNESKNKYDGRWFS